jgi:preprotein translocase subunit SecE
MGVRIPPPVQQKNIKTMTKVFNYISESFEELKSNVTWPQWAEVQRLTIIVAVFSVLFAMATWGVDTTFAKAIKVFFEWLKKV